MKWFAILGLCLFIAIAFAPVINSDINDKIGNISNDNLNHTKQQGQNILKLINGILSYIKLKYGPIPDDDCGCEETLSDREFLIICELLYPFFVISWIWFYIPMLLTGGMWPGVFGALFYFFMQEIGEPFDCYWVY